MNDFAELARQWEAAGLLSPETSLGDVANSLTCGELSRCSARSVDWSCRIGGAQFHFEVHDPLIAQTIRPMLRHLESEEEAGGCRFEICSTTDGQWALLEDGVERLRTDVADEVPGAVFQAILEQLHSVANWRAIVHGGCVALGQGAAVLPAESGSGKTTLVAFLMRNGFQYLADDFVGISAPESCVIPCPLPLSVKEGSWEVLKPAYPKLTNGTPFITKNTRAHLLLPANDAWHQKPVPLKCLIFPKYATKFPANIKPLTATETFRRLLSDRLWLGYPVTDEKVAQFLNWIEGVPSYELRYGDLDDAIGYVRTVLST